MRARSDLRARIKLFDPSHMVYHQDGYNLRGWIDAEKMQGKARERRKR